MAQAPEWLEAEFEIVVNSYDIPETELVEQLQGVRTIGAIGWVKSGIHSFHRGGNTSMLSQMMLQYLEEGRGWLSCPKCSRPF